MVKQNRYIVPIIVFIIIIGAFVAAYFLSKPVGNELEQSVSVALENESRQTPAGIETTNNFLVTSDFTMNEADIRRFLEISPPFEYTLTGSDRSFLLAPNAPLMENTVYTFRVRAKNDALIKSFAFQTRSDLLVSRVYPYNGYSHVPLNSGVEIVFNSENVDISQHFEIQPPVTGTFQTTGNKCVFLPSKQLQENCVYRVRINSGLTSPDGRTLKEPYEFTFETTSEAESEWEYSRLSLSGSFNQTYLPGDAISLELSSGADFSNEQFTMTIHRFAGIDDYSHQLRSRNDFYRTLYGPKRDYIVNTARLEEIYNEDLTLMANGTEFYEGYYINLPDTLSEGQYVITLSQTDTEENERAQFVQKIIAITPLSVYTQSQNGQTLVWLNDPTTSLPVERAKVMIEDINGQNKIEAETNRDGIATLNTDGMDNGYIIVTRAGSRMLFDTIPLSKTREKIPLESQYYTALYTDRPLYQQSDKIRFWGVVKPRGASNKTPQTVRAALGGQLGESIVTTTASVSANGVFSGEIAIENFTENSYILSILDEQNEAYKYSWLEVRQFEKPAYTITIEPEKKQYTFDEKITFNISSSYYDGTPAAGVELSFSMYNFRFDSGVMHETPVKLDAYGKAVVSGHMQLNNSDPNPPLWEPTSVWYSAYSASDQDVNVNTSGSLTIIPSNVALRLTSESPDELTIETAVLDEQKVNQPIARPYQIYNDMYEQLAADPIDVPVTVIVHQVRYLRELVSVGYDNVNKQTVTKYRTTTQEAVVRSIPVATSGGKAVLTGLSYQNSEDEYYWFEARVNGKYTGTVMATATGGVRPLRADDDRVRYTFIDPEQDYNQRRLKTGEEYTLSLFKNGIPEEADGRILMSVLHGDSCTTEVYSSREKTIAMDESLVPNFTVSGAYFDGRHVYVVESASFSYDYDEKQLDIELKTDKESYRPGDSVKLTLTVKDPDGNAVESEVCVGVVDEAVFALAGQELDLLSQIYSQLDGMYIAQSTIPGALDDLISPKYLLNTGGGAMESAAADESGAISGGVRKEFLDTASFVTLATDKSGTAEAVIKLPDNVTSWRITAMAVDSKLQAGQTVSQTPVTLPFFITPVITSTYVSGDDISAGVNSMGVGVELGDAVQYTAVLKNEAGNLLETQENTGEIGTTAHFKFGKQPAGRYSITITAKSGLNTDAVEQTLDIYDNTIVLPSSSVVELPELAKLESVSYPVKITFFDKNLLTYINALNYLRYQSSDDAQQLVAAYKARMLYNATLPEAERETIYRDPRLDQLLPYDFYNEGHAVNEALPASSGGTSAVRSYVEDVPVADNAFYQQAPEPVMVSASSVSAPAVSVSSVAASYKTAAATSGVVIAQAPVPLSAAADTQSQSAADNGENAGTQAILKPEKTPPNTDEPVADEPIADEPVADIEEPVADIAQPDIEEPVADIAQPDTEEPTADIEEPTVDIEEPTAGISQPDSTAEQPPVIHVIPPTAPASGEAFTNDNGDAFVPDERIIGNDEAGAIAKIMIAAPDMINKTNAAEYFRYVLSRPESTQNDRVMAYLGLAACDEPVLLDIKSALRRQADELTTAQALYLGAALARCGDVSGAVSAYGNVSDYRVQTASQLYFSGESKIESLQNTAAALMLTSLANHPDADRLANYLLNRDNQPTQTQNTQIQLELLCYVNSIQLPESNCELTYNDIDGNEQTISFDSENLVVTRSFTKQGLVNADFKVKSGSVTAMAERSVAASESGKTGNAATIEKRFTEISGGDIRAGTRVRVDVTVTFNDSAASGGYTLTDAVPSGMRFLYAMSNGGSFYRQYSNNSGQKVTLRLAYHKPEDGEGKNTFTFSYIAGAILPGSYVDKGAYLTQDNASGYVGKSDSGAVAVLESQGAEAGA